MKGDALIADGLRLEILRGCYQGIIEACDPGCGREDVRETPDRAARAMLEWTAGYRQKPEDVMKLFEVAEAAGDMVIVRNVPFVSMCEHHLAQFTGTVSLGYLPDRKVVGLSKVGRLAEVFARRFQVQERMTKQIADAFWKHVDPRFVGVLVKAEHSCMTTRGVRAHGSDTVSAAFLHKDDDEILAHKSEFFSLLNVR